MWAKTTRLKRYLQVGASGDVELRRVVVGSAACHSDPWPCIDRCGWISSSKQRAWSPYGSLQGLSHHCRVHLTDGRVGAETFKALPVRALHQHRHFVCQEAIASPVVFCRS
jgi:hypothetical protein